MNLEIQEQLASDHEALDERIDQMVLDRAADPVEISELKKVRLRVRDMLEGIIPATLVPAH